MHARKILIIKSLVTVFRAKKCINHFLKELKLVQVFVNHGVLFHFDATRFTNMNPIAAALVLCCLSEIFFPLKCKIEEPLAQAYLLSLGQYIKPCLVMRTKTKSVSIILFSITKA